ncbi:hypothetical protein TNCV_4079811 [Trichonephila clavipes]|nr:hypothetical protein TNCV_4079811 [Trichonephila clavipes]
MRSMIRFLWVNNVSASDIHSQIVEVYGEEAMSRQHLVKWCRYFQSARQDVNNRNMAGSCRPSSLTTEINMKNPKGPKLTNMATNVAKVAKLLANLVAKYDANLALSPRSRQVPIESAL